MKQTLERFNRFSEIWAREIEAELKDFLAQDPKVNEFESVIKKFEAMEAEIQSEPLIYEVGPIAIFSGMFIFYASFILRKNKNISYVFHSFAHSLCGLLALHNENPCCEKWLDAEFSYCDGGISTETHRICVLCN